MAKKKSEISEEVPSVEETPSSETPPETTSETELPELEDTQSFTKQELEDHDNAVKGPMGNTLKVALDAHAALQRSYDTERGRNSTLETGLKELKDKERARELREVDGKPDLVDSVRLKHEAEDLHDAATKERSVLDSEKASHKAQIDAALKAEADTLAKELAADSGLNATLILQIGTDTAEGGKVSFNLDRMKQVATSVPKGETDDEEEEEPQVRGQVSRAKSVGTHTAQRGYRTWPDYEKAFGREEISYEQYTEAAKRFNVEL